ncbi:hypothetical protein RRG08_055405 [Elysia crispata]|uniref:Uncharacterized protein n=1 Tax=Elysia crispata TaxID=231223 RepID=A0AAE1AQF8_9GAST|nr:hypothetical protein RRG08_055405 [Elysia crispata]
MRRGVCFIIFNITSSVDSRHCREASPLCQWVITAPDVAVFPVASGWPQATGSVPLRSLIELITSGGSASRGNFLNHLPPYLPFFSSPPVKVNSFVRASRISVGNSRQCKHVRSSVWKPQIYGRSAYISMGHDTCYSSRHWYVQFSSSKQNYFENTLQFTELPPVSLYNMILSKHFTTRRALCVLLETLWLDLQARLSTGSSS